MRSSSFLVALQAGCLSLAAPTALGFGSHQKRCTPGSIEALEADYYHRSEGGNADHRKAVEMCIRLTLPVPSPENRPRVPSAVELVPCDGTPEAPRSTQMYMRITLPDSSIHEAHRTPSIVDPSPFAAYSKDLKHDSGSHGPSGDDAATRHGNGVADEASTNNVHGPSGQDQTGSNGHSSNNASASKTNAAQHQVPDPGNHNGGARAGSSTGPNGGNGGNGGNSDGSGNGATGGGEGTGAQGSSRQNSAAMYGGGSNSPSPSPASDGASSGSDEDRSFRHGALRASHPSTKSGSEADTAPTDDDSLLNVKVHAAAFGGHDESGNTLPIDSPADKDRILDIKVHAAALSTHGGPDDSLPIDSPADKLLNVKVHAAAVEAHGGSGNVLPIDSPADRLLNDGENTAEITNGGDYPNELDAARLPSGSGSVAASVNPPSRSDLPASEANNDGHLVNVKATTPTHDGGDEPTIREPDAPEPHALLEVKGTAPKNVDNGPSASGTPADDATHRATLLNVKGAVSPPEHVRS